MRLNASKCVKNARNTFGGEHLLDDTDTPTPLGGSPCEHLPIKSPFLQKHLDQHVLQQIILSLALENVLPCSVGDLEVANPLHNYRRSNFSGSHIRTTLLLGGGREGVNREKLTVKKIINNEMFFFSPFMSLTNREKSA